MNRNKKQKPIEEPRWECSVCTYRNAPEAFKCLMCDVRKGTSTRKPKMNLQLASANQQFATTSTKNINNKREDDSNHKSDKRKKKFKKSWRPSKLKNVDRSSAQAREITINNLTIMITEYKVKEKRSNNIDQAEHSSASEISSQSESGVDSSINSVSSGKMKSVS